ncbi:MATE family efflux transporter [Latilactobacillus graminis]|uniref:Polysaccharide biosynthesis family protein n=2 Tax=Latilactobacillus graminis TaxID=60519 RepID=A0AA89I6G7_9LACO|nr:MATE family efflux transporter [Latilactobacillus graminis]KRM21189.1 polysaccharide biosynthesis family protein [Latilactobacillus graminis DSM 20719]QFP79316.1 MATE family efflux transporter [Latilactobacillus graminis]
MENASQIKKELTGYIIRDVFSSLGLSIYILADTYFIAYAVGPIGLAALNIDLPIFNLFNGLGLMLGIGGATIFSINKSKHPDKSRAIFTEVLTFGILLGLVIMALGLIFIQPLLHLLGANQETLAPSLTYLRVILIGSPLFIINNLVLSFVRNDNNPHLTMIATLSQSLFVIIFDYLLMFPLHMGMLGAAMATICSPLVSLIILTQHRKHPQRLLTLQHLTLHFKPTLKAIQLGFPSFLTEMSTGVSIFVFNIVILHLSNNYAVAAYGIIANILLVGLSLFNGVAVGIQPIVSREFGKQHWANIKISLKIGLLTSVAIAAGLYLVLIGLKFPIIDLFNHEHNQALVHYAATGIPLIFLSFFFSSMNIVNNLFITAIAQPRLSFFVAIMRGYVLLIASVLVLSALFGLTGVWLSVPLTEILIFIMGMLITRSLLKTNNSV